MVGVSNRWLGIQIRDSQQVPKPLWTHFPASQSLNPSSKRYWRRRGRCKTTPQRSDRSPESRWTKDLCKLLGGWRSRGRIHPMFCPVCSDLLRNKIDGPNVGTYRSLSCSWFYFALLPWIPYCFSASIPGNPEYGLNITLHNSCFSNFIHPLTGTGWVPKVKITKSKAGFLLGGH